MPDFKIETLVLDAAPLLSTAASSSASALRGLADNFTTTPDVVGEIRDKTSRDLFNSTLQVLGLESANDSNATGGLQVKTPSAEAVSRVTAFAKLTGDVAVLSEADIRVLALTYALEVEANGLRRIRQAPGKLSPEEQERENKKQERLASLEAEKNIKESQQQLQKLNLEQATEEEEYVPEASTSSLPPPPPTQELEGHEQAEGQNVQQDDQAEHKEEGLDHDKSDSQDSVREADSKSASDSDSDSEGDGEWITPTNVTLYKSRDLGLFPSLPASHPEAMLAETEKKGKKKQKTVLKVACLTGDFAMQNVALQMGLNVFGVGGQKIKEVKTWVLRCHACFKLCKDPERKFCPSCGNPSLLRTSITYVTPSPENPKGYILHLKANFQYRLRGTQYSIPSPKPGSSNAAKNSKNSDLILREDQKEYQRGLRSADYLKKKQEKAAAKAIRDGKTGGTASVFSGWDDPDWSPEMLMGEKGRKGGLQGIRVGKDGLPIIGHGRRNPNENRKGGK